MNCPKCNEELTSDNIDTSFVTIDDIEKLEVTITCFDCGCEGFAFMTCDDIIYGD